MFYMLNITNFIYQQYYNNIALYNKILSINLYLNKRICINLINNI
jgi:hypothetical protein